jgi:hypothetical protein
MRLSDPEERIARRRSAPVQCPQRVDSRHEQEAARLVGVRHFMPTAATTMPSRDLERQPSLPRETDTKIN